MRSFWKLEGIIHPKKKKKKKSYRPFSSQMASLERLRAIWKGLFKREMREDCGEQNINQAFIAECEVEKVDYRDWSFSTSSFQVEFVRWTHARVNWANSCMLHFYYSIIRMKPGEARESYTWLGLMFWISKHWRIRGGEEGRVGERRRGRKKALWSAFNGLHRRAWATAAELSVRVQQSSSKQSQPLNRPALSHGLLRLQLQQSAWNFTYSTISLWNVNPFLRAQSLDPVVKRGKKKNEGT